MNDVHGGDTTSFQREYPGRSALDFSANINPLGLPEGVRQAYIESALDTTAYPDPHCRELRGALSRYEQLPPEWILCGNGASDLIYRIAWALRPRRALLLAPTFSEYERALKASGCEIRYYNLREEEGFLPGSDLPGAVDGCDLVFLCNPNNPTGGLMQPALLKAILERCAENGAILAIDECFLDFIPQNEQYSMKSLLMEYGNLLILRAFTKIFAMPGLRLGYLLCADEERLAAIERAGAPWAVSVPAQRCGTAAVEEREYLAETHRLLPGWRAYLARGLTELGFTVYPGAANYLFFYGRAGVAPALRPHGILLRDCASFNGLKAGYYRAAVRPQKEIEQLLSALRII